MTEKSRNNRDVILDIALELFSARGYEAVGISEITEKAGISKPTLYYYFGSKEGLFSDLLQFHYNALNEALRQVCRYTHHQNYDEDIYPVLCEVVKAYFRFAKQYPDFYLIALSLTFTPPESAVMKIAADFHQVQYSLIEDLFLEISAFHTNLKGKENRLMRSLLAVINAQISGWYQHQAALAEADAQALVKLFMHGIFV
jgi:AcrR family transcriptional regulator